MLKQLVNYPSRSRYQRYFKNVLLKYWFLERIRKTKIWKKKWCQPRRSRRCSWWGLRSQCRFRTSWYATRHSGLCYLLRGLMLYLPHSLSPCLACSTSCAIVPSFMRGFFPGVHFCTSCDKKTIIMRSSADNLQFNSTDVHQPCKGGRKGRETSLLVFTGYIDGFSTGEKQLLGHGRPTHDIFLIFASFQ